MPVCLHLHFRYLVLHDFGQARWNCRHLLRQENKADSEAVDLTQSYEVSIGKLLNKEDGWRHLSADGGQGIEKVVVLLGALWELGSGTHCFVFIKGSP